MGAIRRFLVGGLAVMTGVLLVAACSSPTKQARACGAKTQLQRSLDEIRGFDYTTQHASELTTALDSLQRGLKTAEVAVPLPQNTRLRQFGGVGRLRMLSGQINSLAQNVHSSGSAGQPGNLTAFEGTVMQRAAEVQQITDAIGGC
jgi:hypothetical protein